MSASHASSRDDFQNSSPALDALIEAAEESPGFLGGKLSGAGWAGCTVNLVRSRGRRGLRRIRPDRLRPTDRPRPRRPHLPRRRRGVLHGRSVDRSLRTASGARPVPVLRVAVAAIPAPEQAEGRVVDQRLRAGELVVVGVAAVEQGVGRRGDDRPRWRAGGGRRRAAGSSRRRRCSGGRRGSRSSSCSRRSGRPAGGRGGRR